MSPHQAKQALRVANVPSAEFERAIEGDKPATVTKLAAMGTKPAPRPIIDLKGRDPGEFNRALHFVAGIEEYANALSKFQLDAILPTLVPAEAERVRAAIGKSDAIHDRIITRI